MIKVVYWGTMRGKYIINCPIDKQKFTIFTIFKKI